MEGILHIEPITRHVKAPLDIGDTQHIFYGEGEVDEESDYESYAADMRLGSPLSTIDICQPAPFSVPLVKTIGFFPDRFQMSGNIYSETIHYVKDGTYLIPIKTKLRSGLSEGLRLNHLPSLSYARKDLAGGNGESVQNPMPEILNALLVSDENFKKRAKHPVLEWVHEDLIDAIMNIPTCVSTLSSDDVLARIGKYSHQILSVPFNDMSAHHCKDIFNIVTHDPRAGLPEYTSQDVIGHKLVDFRNHLVPHTAQFHSMGNIEISDYPYIATNPIYFQDVSEFLDTIPLTDFNIDVVFGDNEIVLLHDHLLMNRICQFKENRVTQNDLKDTLDIWLTPKVILTILEKIVHHHPTITDHIKDILISEPIKIKLIKTLNEECAILVYLYNSGPKDLPLCGVYFDLALLSLAPLSVIPVFLK